MAPAQSHKLNDAGSSPAPATNGTVTQQVECQIEDLVVIGSIPISSTEYFSSSAKVATPLHGEGRWFDPTLKYYFDFQYILSIFIE